MTSHTRYLLTETTISVLINAALSVGFVHLIFHGQRQVPMRGLHGVVADMVLQTFMVVLMACLVPALLTRKRWSDGTLLWHHPHGRLTKRSIAVAAVVAAVVSSCAAVAVSWAVLPSLLPAGVAFRLLVPCKAAFGMLLAAAATPWAVTRALR